MGFRWSSIWERPAERFRPQRVIGAAQAFLATEAASGFVLLAAAAAALIWINSPWEDSYVDLWHTDIVVDLGIFSIEEPLQEWVNEGLMTVFFFLVGLEIKRELDHGELSTARKAALPAIAALGGMVVPALIYVSINAGGDAGRGWGIPMATDIAFAVGVLSLTARHAPLGLRIFLLALAIVDDIGAIIIIALFYTESVDYQALLIAAGLLGLTFAMNRAGVRNIAVYLILGGLIWVAMLESGVHATLAGVVLGLLTPPWAYYSRESFAESAEELSRRFRDAMSADRRDEQDGLLRQIEELSRETVAPLVRLEHALQPWVSYGIIPIFALANAGVALSADSIEAAASSAATIGVAAGLVVGKPVGILIFSLLAVRLGLSELPAGTGWRHIFGVGMIAGIGFTVSLFITGLAFDDPVLVDDAKIGILAGSAISAIAGLAFMRYVARTAPASVQ